MYTHLLRRSAHLASGLVALMFITFIASGVGQEGLQVFHVPHDYAALLLKNPAALSLTLGLDGAFIVCYLTTFLTLAATRWNAPGRAVLAAALAFLVATATLDVLENLHFITMLQAATAGVEPSVTQIEAQIVESMLKFHLSYVGLWLLGATLPRSTRLERALVFSLKWVQLPVGLAVPLVPHAVAVPLVVVRFSFFLFSLLAVAAASKRPEFGSDAPG